LRKESELESLEPDAVLINDPPPDTEELPVQEKPPE
jgi:hypothetical protein